MNIKNYTSEVSVEKSIAKIEHLLIQAGASHISKSIKGGKIEGFMFQLFVAQNNHVTFKLPSKVDKVFEKFWKEVSPRSIGSREREKQRREKVWEQAERTAWKLLYDWIYDNVSLILIEQVKPHEVFLPYAYDFEKDETLFDKVEKGGLQMIGMGKK